MIIFLLIFLFIYGGLNFYAFFQAKNVFHFSGKPEIIIIILLFCLILAPIIIRFAEKTSLGNFGQINRLLGLSLDGIRFSVLLYQYHLGHCPVYIQIFLPKLRRRSSEKLFLQSGCVSFSCFCSLRIF